MNKSKCNQAPLHLLIRSLLTSFVILVGLSPTAPVIATSWVDVSADEDTYFVRGGVVHHSTYEDDRTEAATCENCHWRLEVLCQTFLVGSQGACPGLRARCGASSRPVAVYRANASSRPPTSSSLWHRTGYSCVGPGGPISTGEINSKLTGDWQVKVPTLTAVTVPPTNTLVNLPTLVKLTSPGRLIVSKPVVAGVEVTLYAVASRSVSCLGASCELPSARTLRFGDTGMATVTVKATWRGKYDANGLTGIPISDDPIVQSKKYQLQVYSLHRKLITVP